MEDMVVKIMDEERAINEEIDRLVDTRCQIRQVIDRMPNVTQRLVLEKRSLLFQTWQQIGADLHLSARWAQVIYRNAVRAVQEILDQNEGEE